MIFIKSELNGLFFFSQNNFRRAENIVAKIFDFGVLYFSGRLNYSEKKSLTFSSEKKFSE